MDSEDVDYNQAQPDAQPDAQLSPSNDFQGLVLTPTVYLVVVQPFKDKIAEQQKVIEKLEEKNRELLKPIGLGEQSAFVGNEMQNTRNSRKKWAERCHTQSIVARGTREVSAAANNDYPVAAIGENSFRVETREQISACAFNLELHIEREILQNVKVILPFSPTPVSKRVPLAQEPIIPSPTTSSNPFAVRDAPVSNDNPEKMESTGRIKTFSENSTDMFSSLLAMVQRYEELERENGGLRLESESTKLKLKDKDNELKMIQTEMATQKNEFNALKQNWANERTRLTTDHAHQLRQMEDVHQICLNRISTQHVETLRIKEEANLTTLAQKEQLITALRRSGEQLETSHEAQKRRWEEERDGLQSELKEKQDMVDVLVETKNGLIDETKELKEEYLKAAVYQNKASIAEWSAVENIIGDLSTTIRSSLKCQFPDLQEALDLCRETKEKYEKSLDENLEDQKKIKKNAEVGGEQGSSAETKRKRVNPHGKEEQKMNSSRLGEKLEACEKNMNLKLERSRSCIEFHISEGSFTCR
ncbi:hypothetical protein B9Z55_007329 [Caenorhabditis nigoni]|nr:hypothetical protein B9Z55_007329 [Caenorhabditis nigoni]